MPRKQAHNPNQQQLPFEVEYRERFRLLDAIGSHRTGLTRVRWRRVRDLLKAVHKVDQGEGCWGSIAWLAEQCEASQRTVSTAIADAKALGVLEVEPRTRRTGNGGRMSNVLRVRWRAVAGLGVPAEAPSSGVDCRNAEVDRRNAEVDCKNCEAIEENTKLSSTGRDGSGATEEIDSGCLLTGEQLAAACDRVRRVLVALGPPKEARDYGVAAKAALWSVTRFGERWLENTLQAVVHTKWRRKPNPWGCWWTVLCGAVNERLGPIEDAHDAAQLERMLKRTTVPPELREALRGIIAALSERQQRLCVAGGDE